jgi:hypothetical protein
MKRPRHRRKKPGFVKSQEHEPVGLADLYPDLFLDLPESLRRDLPSAVLKSQREQDQTNENEWG